MYFHLAFFTWVHLNMTKFCINFLQIRHENHHSTDNPVIFENVYFSCSFLTFYRTLKYFIEHRTQDFAGYVNIVIDNGHPTVQTIKGVSEILPRHCLSLNDMCLYYYSEIMSAGGSLVIKQTLLSRKARHGWLRNKSNTFQAFS